MKKKNREINIFNMSALDLFASALGAFILISLILFPYYLKVDPKFIEENKKLKAALTKCQDKNSVLNGQLGTCQGRADALSSQLIESEERGRALNGELGECRQQNQSVNDQLAQSQQQNKSYLKELKEAFLIMVMTWNTKDDIDLYVVDPRGNEYFYKKPTFPGSPYELSVDTVTGPGVEIWEGPGAEPGTYKIYYHLYATKDYENPQVRGRLYYRNKVFLLNTKTMTYKGEKILVATVNIDSKGRISVIKH
jgi:hypothetical protein